MFPLLLLKGMEHRVAFWDSSGQGGRKYALLKCIYVKTYGTEAQKMNDDFDWQKAQEQDEEEMRLAQLALAKKIASGGTTVADAVEYLVCQGWSQEEAGRSLGLL